MRKNLLVCLLAFASPVLAQPLWPEQLDVDLSYRNSAATDQDRRWDIRLGAGIEREPTFQGSDRSATEFDPYLILAYRADWGNLFAAGDGLGYSRVFGDRFGLLLRLEDEDARELDDDPRLIGLAQEEELELEITGRYFFGSWTVGGSIATATGDKGTVWFLGGGRTFRLADDRLFVTLNADLSASNQDNQRTDFGITAEQSAISGFPVYDPGGGLKSLGINLSAEYELSKHWFLYADIEHERLLRDVADSPLVTNGGSDNNLEAAIGFYYRF